jgi:hypothetical protein
MKRVECMSPLSGDHSATCHDEACQGGCPLDERHCVYATYGLAGGFIGVYQQCMTLGCEFGEVIPDPEMEPKQSQGEPPCRDCKTTEKPRSACPLCKQVFCQRCAEAEGSCCDEGKPFDRRRR